MENEFVPYEIALALKELGFDEPCLGGYYEDKTFEYHPDSDIVVDTPLYQQAFRWFRETHNLHHTVLFDNTDNKYDYIYGKRIGGSMLGKTNSYQEGELKCLKELIEIVKNK